MTRRISAFSSWRGDFCVQWRGRALNHARLTSGFDAGYSGGMSIMVFEIPIHIHRAPQAMTAAVILAGLAPIMWSDGTGAEVMQRIAAPMIGGMITAPLLSMLVIPAAYYLIWRHRIATRRSHQTRVS